jgi:hypothetical protein
MVKLTVLYNLPPDADHDAYLAWRTTTHQEANASAPGVLKTDFYVAKATPLGEPAYRYITEAWFETMADLEAAFFTDEAQAQLQVDIQRIADPVFLVSEEVVTTVLDRE